MRFPTACPPSLRSHSAMLSPVGRVLTSLVWYSECRRSKRLPPEGLSPGDRRGADCERFGIVGCSGVPGAEGRVSTAEGGKRQAEIGGPARHMASLPQGLQPFFPSSSRPPRAWSP
jgi:hypothetical protein